jgi:hypothetical protein
MAIFIPFDMKTFRTFRDTFYRRDLWPDQPAGFETGYDSPFDAGDVRMNLWKLFEDFSERHGGEYSSRVDVALQGRASISPDLVYYGPDRKDILIEEDYFGAAPDLVADVQTAASRAVTRGPRQQVYRRAGIPNWWVVEPANETIEVYELHGQYELIGVLGAGDSFASPLFPGERISVDALFSTRRKRRGGAHRKL